MDKKITYVVMIVWIITIVSPLINLTAVDAQASDDIDTEIHVPGEDPVISNGKKVIVTGIINIINCSFSFDVDEIDIVLFKGTEIPTQKNFTNYYRWNFSKGSFQGRYEDGKYLEEDMCEFSDRWVRFACGSSVVVSEGEWTLRVINPLGNFSEDVLMQVPDLTLGLTTPSFYFTTAPYSGENFNSSNNRLYMRTMNNGNVPMRLNVLYDKYGDYLTTTNTSGVFKTGEERRHHVSFETPIWGPNKVEIRGSVRGEPYYTITPSTINLIQIPELTFKVTIEIVRPGLKLVDLGPVKAQYHLEENIKYGSTKTLEMYLSGWDDVEIRVSAHKLGLNSIIYEGKKMGENFTLSLSNDSEEEVIFEVEGTEANQVGELRYSVQAQNHDVNQILVTQVTTGPSYEQETDNDEDQEKSIYGILIAVIVLAGAVIFAVYYGKKKKKEEKND